MQLPTKDFESNRPPEGVPDLRFTGVRERIRRFDTMKLGLSVSCHIRFAAGNGRRAVPRNALFEDSYQTGTAPAEHQFPDDPARQERVSPCRG